MSTSIATQQPPQADATTMAGRRVLTPTRPAMQTSGEPPHSDDAPRETENSRAPTPLTTLKRSREDGDVSESAASERESKQRVVEVNGERKAIPVKTDSVASRTVAWLSSKVKRAKKILRALPKTAVAQSWKERVARFKQMAKDKLLPPLLVRVPEITNTGGMPGTWVSHESANISEADTTATNASTESRQPVDRQESTRPTSEIEVGISSNTEPSSTEQPQSTREITNQSANQSPVSPVDRDENSKYVREQIWEEQLRMRKQKKEDERAAKKAFEASMRFRPLSEFGLRDPMMEDWHRKLAAKKEAEAHELAKLYEKRRQQEEQHEKEQEEQRKKDAEKYAKEHAERKARERAVLFDPNLWMVVWPSDRLTRFQNPMQSYGDWMRVDAQTCPQPHPVTGYSKFPTYLSREQAEPILQRIEAWLAQQAAQSHGSHLITHCCQDLFRIVNELPPSQRHLVQPRKRSAHCSRKINKPHQYCGHERSQIATRSHRLAKGTAFQKAKAERRAVLLSTTAPVPIPTGPVTHNDWCKLTYHPPAFLPRSVTDEGSNSNDPKGADPVVEDEEMIEAPEGDDENFEAVEGMDTFGNAPPSNEDGMETGGVTYTDAPTWCWQANQPVNESPEDMDMGMDDAEQNAVPWQLPMFGTTGGSTASQPTDPIQQAGAGTNGVEPADNVTANPGATIPPAIEDLLRSMTAQWDMLHQSLSGMEKIGGLEFATLNLLHDKFLEPSISTLLAMDPATIGVDNFRQTGWNFDRLGGFYERFLRGSDLELSDDDYECRAKVKSLLKEFGTAFQSFSESGKRFGQPAVTRNAPTTVLAQQNDGQGALDFFLGQKNAAVPRKQAGWERGNGL